MRRRVNNLRFGWLHQRQHSHSSRSRSKCVGIESFMERIGKFGGLTGLGRAFHKFLRVRNAQIVSLPASPYSDEAHRTLVKMQAWPESVNLRNQAFTQLCAVWSSFGHYAQATLLRPDSSEPVRQRRVQVQVLAITANMLQLNEAFAPVPVILCCPQLFHKSNPAKRRTGSRFQSPHPLSTLFLSTACPDSMLYCDLSR